MAPRKSKASAAAEEQIITGDNGAKRAVLDKAVGDILKRYGDGSIMRLGEAKHMETEAFPTGSLSLDIALGVGGVPRGRITEVYGPESSGKTTICQHIVAEAQRMGGVAAYIDMEHALDPIYAARCGVDIDNLLVSQPDTGEQALEITETLVRSGGIDVIVIEPGTTATPIIGKVSAEAEQYAHTDYGPLLAQMTGAAIAKRQQTAIPVAKVAAAIVAALENPHPKTRYAIPRKWLTGWFLPRISPDRWFDRLVARELKLR